MAPEISSTAIWWSVWNNQKTPVMHRCRWLSFSDSIRFGTGTDQIPSYAHVHSIYDPDINVTCRQTDWKWYSGNKPVSLWCGFWECGPHEMGNIFARNRHLLSRFISMSGVNGVSWMGRGTVNGSGREEAACYVYGRWRMIINLALAYKGPAEGRMSVLL